MYPTKREKKKHRSGPVNVGYMPRCLHAVKPNTRLPMPDAQNNAIRAFLHQRDPPASHKGKWILILLFLHCCATQVNKGDGTALKEKGQGRPLSVMVAMQMETP